MGAGSELAGPIYRGLSQVPEFKAAQFQASNVVRVITSAHDHIRNIHRPIAKTFTVNADGSISMAVSPDSSEVVTSMASPSGKYLAVLREICEAPFSEKKRYVEVWEADRLKLVENVTDKHGQFYTDEFLSSISFSPSETKVAYVAEAKPEEDGSESDLLAKYRFVPELGEAYGGRKKPVVFLLDLSRDVGQAVTALALSERSLPSSAPLLSHPVFASEHKIIALGYEYSDDGRMLGPIYCPNRAANIWELSLPQSNLKTEGKATLKCTGKKLTTSGLACRSPRVFKQDDRTFVLYASNAVGGPHQTCSRIQVTNLETAETRTLLETVQDPDSADFPGLYASSLPAYPFLQPASAEDPRRFLIVSSVWRCRTTVLLLSLITGKVVDLTPDTDEHHWSWTVLCTDGRSQVICARSALNKLPELVLGQVDGNAGAVKWRVLAKPTVSDELRKKLDDLTVSIIPIPDRYPTETIVVQSKKNLTALNPCVTIPHGGPHSASTTAFQLSFTSFALEGYTVAMPNYTGSIGFGEKYVLKLLGEAGRLDVNDCIASVRHLVARGISEPGNQYLTGGSHGGFIIGHLIGQFPDTFVAATLRNPVTNLGETSVTDIPDWYFEEIGVPYTSRAVMTPSIYARGFERSPMAHVDRIRAPLQVHLGLKDQRVAVDQGKKFYHALRARGVDAEMLVFPDDRHPIDSVEGSRASYHATKMLFGRCTSDRVSLS